MKPTTLPNKSLSNMGTSPLKGALYHASLKAADIGARGSLAIMCLSLAGVGLMAAFPVLTPFMIPAIGIIAGTLSAAAISVAVGGRMAVALMPYKNDLPKADVPAVENKAIITTAILGLAGVGAGYTFVQPKLVTTPTTSMTFYKVRGPQPECRLTPVSGTPMPQQPAANYVITYTLPKACSLEPR